MHSLLMSSLDVLKQEIMGIAMKAAANAMAETIGKFGPVGMIAAGAVGAMSFGMVSAWANKLKPATPKKMNSGGIVDSGMVGVDTVPALLSRGEMVLPKSVTDQILAIAGKPQPKTSPARFASGGIAQPAQSARPHGERPVLQVNTLSLPNRAQARRWLRDVVAPELNTLKQAGQISL